MGKARLLGWSKQRLRLVLLGFFLALLVPTAFLIKQAYSQLKWEAFHQHRSMAEELVQRIDRRYRELLETESARRFTEYAFLNVTGDPDTNYVQRSPLSNFPVQSTLPGVIGYFQVDPQGRFSTPLLPDDELAAQRYGIAQAELVQRRELQARLLNILTENQLVQRPVPLRLAEEALPQAPSLSSAGVIAEQDAQSVQQGFDKLQSQETYATAKKKFTPKSLGRVEDLKLEDRYRQKAADAEQAERVTKAEEEKTPRVLRKEQSVLLEQELRNAPVEAAQTPAAVAPRVRMFESEIDRFEFSVLDSGQFVLYRKVWRDGQRYIQGLLLEPGAFIAQGVRETFYETALSGASRLAVAYQGNVLSVLNSRVRRDYLASSEVMRGTLLYQASLSAPLNDVELIFSIEQLPAGPGGTVVTWLGVIIVLILCGGFLLLYRLGLRQITLAQQQQDFVSAVSHELKTPLTSIRMYGEMLREGWAPEEKRRSYYDFIFEESERLTRLINNVLQLARMTRHELRLELKTCTVAQLIDMARSKVTTQIERADFNLQLHCPDGLDALQLQVDADHFVQILINLVDNALKFSAKAENKTIEIGCERAGNDRIQFTVRDHGPGIARDQLRKIFHLFYRSENELTRETVGTGIGLALVLQLVQAMHGEVDVVNREPGAEFRISFPIQFSP